MAMVLALLFISTLLGIIDTKSIVIKVKDGKGENENIIMKRRSKNEESIECSFEQKIVKRVEGQCKMFNGVGMCVSHTGIFMDLESSWCEQSGMKQGKSVNCTIDVTEYKEVKGKCQIIGTQPVCMAENGDLASLVQSCGGMKKKNT